jgi:hypothetical protein
LKAPGHDTPEENREQDKIAEYIFGLVTKRRQRI